MDTLCTYIYISTLYHKQQNCMTWRFSYNPNVLFIMPSIRLYVCIKKSYSKFMDDVVRNSYHFIFVFIFALSLIISHDETYIIYEYKYNNFYFFQFLFSCIGVFFS